MTGIFLAIFLGWAGAYQFYSGKAIKGLIYLFTMGLFGIGWITDIVQAVRDYRAYQRTKHIENNTTSMVNHLSNISAKLDSQQGYSTIAQTSDKSQIEDCKQNSTPCYICQLRYYHTNLLCPALQNEQKSTIKSAKIMSIDEAEAWGLKPCSCTKC